MSSGSSPGRAYAGPAFTHKAAAIDTRFAGWLGGAYVFSQRLVNFAPAATAMSDANGEAVAKINDESNNNMWLAWDNGPDGGTWPVSPEHPVDLVLDWRQPVAIRAWALGPASRLPTCRPMKAPPTGHRERPPRSIGGPSLTGRASRTSTPVASASIGSIWVVCEARGRSACGSPRSPRRATRTWRERPERPPRLARRTARAASLRRRPALRRRHRNRPSHYMPRSPFASRSTRPAT